MVYSSEAEALHFSPDSRSPYISSRFSVREENFLSPRGGD